MAGKNARGTQFDPAACQDLQTAATEAVNLMNGKYDAVQEVFGQIRGDEVIGDSNSKDRLLEVLDKVDLTFNTITEKLERARSIVEQVTAIAEESMKQNNAATEAAAADVSKVAASAEDVDGTGAQA